jgi:3'-phosphoadenosine 5'-phosphosulfate sulfotransferase (PAPS reductase)/FAD synthetase
VSETVFHQFSQLDEKELLLNQQKKEVQSKTRKLKAHLTQQEMVNSELAMKLKQQEQEKVTRNSFFIISTSIGVDSCICFHYCWNIFGCNFVITAEFFSLRP